MPATKRCAERCAWWPRIVVMAAVFTAPITCCNAQSGSPSDAMVRPCNDSEWRLVFSDEAKQLTQKRLEYTRGFSSCEAAIIPFLGPVRILRLHTPTWVDYSYTATILQAKRDGPLRIVSSGRGMVALPQPDAADSIAALNFVLAGANLNADKRTIKTISDLYFFMLDSERGVFGVPIAKQMRHLDKYDHKTNVRTARDSAVTKYSDNPWQLMFQIKQGSIQLSSASRRDQ
jgi:hypothetical protein